VKRTSKIAKLEEKAMRNEYTLSETIEIGEAQELILGNKMVGSDDLDQPYPASLDLDE
jgi:hypothetical protein